MGASGIDCDRLFTHDGGISIHISFSFDSSSGKVEVSPKSQFILNEKKIDV